MISRTFLAAIISLIAFTNPALALSCTRPDVKRAFSQALEAEEMYSVVIGTLTFDLSKLPMAVGNDSPPQTLIPARIEGKALTGTGFDHEFTEDITLDVLCFGPWCGGAGSGVEYLTFLRKDAQGYVMVADPCNSLNFQEPTETMRQAVEKCFIKGECPA